MDLDIPLPSFVFFARSISHFKNYVPLESVMPSGSGGLRPPNDAPLTQCSPSTSPPPHEKQKLDPPPFSRPVRSFLRSQTYTCPPNQSPVSTSGGSSPMFPLPSFCRRLFPKAEYCDAFRRSRKPPPQNGLIPFAQDALGRPTTPSFEVPWLLVPSSIFF